MLWKKIKEFWNTGLTEKNRIPKYFVVISAFALVIISCGDEERKPSEIGMKVVDGKISSLDKSESDDIESITVVYRDIYDEVIETHTPSSLETTQCIVSRLGENGYVAVDSENQVDMVGAEQVTAFCRAVEQKKKAELTILVIKDSGFQKFDFQTEDGNVMIVRGYYQYDENGCFQNRNMVSYPADVWKYTEEGYLIVEGSYFSDMDFVLTLSDTPERTALRVLPLDETCRELNRKYILPVGYEKNNMFLTDWSEEDFADLDFYDVFDVFYSNLYQQSVPYVADENLSIGKVYQIPEEIFEKVVLTYFDMDSDVLRSKTTYDSENTVYEYRPRGFYEIEYLDIPYPEVVSYTENQDGTITLMVNAVYPNGNTSKLFSHKTVIRPSEGDSFQYVSNQVNLLEKDRNIWWHSNRLTREKWVEIYGEIGE